MINLTNKQIQTLIDHYANGKIDNVVLAKFFLNNENLVVADCSQMVGVNVTNVFKNILVFGEDFEYAPDVTVLTPLTLTNEEITLAEGNVYTIDDEVEGGNYYVMYIFNEAEFGQPGDVLTSGYYYVGQKASYLSNLTINHIVSVGQLGESPYGYAPATSFKVLYQNNLQDDVCCYFPSVSALTAFVNDETSNPKLAGDVRVYEWNSSPISINLNGLFNGTNVKSIDYIGNQISLIDGDFTNCPNLEEINLSNCSSSLGDIFSGSVYPYHVSIYYGNQTKSTLPVGCFKGSNIKKITLPENTDNILMSIPASCFEGCTQLEEIVIPYSYNTIGANAFKGCTNLKSVYLPDTIVWIEPGAFEGCNNIARYQVYRYSKDDKQMVPTCNAYVGTRGLLMQRVDIDGVNGLKIVAVNHNFLFGNYYDEYLGDCFYMSAADIIDTNMWDITKIKIVPGLLLVNDSTFSGTGMRVISSEGGVYDDALMITPLNQATIISTYGENLNSSNASHFLVPMFMLATEAGESCCVGDSLVANPRMGDYDWREYFPFFRKYGKKSFKGSGISQATFVTPNVPTGTTAAITFDESCFEGCTSLYQVTFNTQTYLKDKCFYGCSNLTSLTVNYQILSLGNNAQNPANSLCFGNTPSLASIGGANNNNSGYYAVNNAIIYDSNEAIAVGCKNTDFNALYTTYETDTIHDGAFYGCTGLTSVNLDNYEEIKSNAFYGCTGLTTANLSTVQFIHSKAFYGCTSLSSVTLANGQYNVSIGSQAFANTALQTIAMNTKVTSCAQDAFDKCTNVTTVTAQDNVVFATSVANTENALLFKTPDINHLTLAKGGNGKSIVNTEYTQKEITTIKSNAFDHVELMSNSNASGTIYVPKSVTTLGSNVFNSCTVDNSGEDVTLKLCGEMVTKTSYYNNGVSYEMLFRIGGKYFKKIVEDTASFNGHKYVPQITTHDNKNCVSIVENLLGSNQKEVLKVYYDHEGNIKLLISHFVMGGYDQDDSKSHVATLTHDNEFTLLYYGQTITSEGAAVFFENGISAGSWAGLTINNDIQLVSNNNQVDTYSSVSPNTFASCTWINNIIFNKKYSGFEGGFKGCTNLINYSTTLTSNETYHTSLLHDGVMPKSIFEGCKMFNGSYSTISDLIEPLKFDENCLKGCDIRDSNYNTALMLGTTFEKGAFVDTKITRVNLISAMDIDASAFDGLNLSSATADGTTGYYYTGCGLSIMDNTTKKIVLGSANTDFDDNFTGIGDHAFYGRTIQSVAYRNKTALEIGEAAFSKSTVVSLTETSCQNTIIGKDAFKDCTYLTNITLGTGSRIRSDAFSGCTALSTANILDAELASGVFSGCTSLSSITIANSVGANAFKGDTSLTRVLLNYSASSNKTIASTAFVGCPIDIFVINGSSTTTKYEFNTIYITQEVNGLTGALVSEVLVGTKAFVNAVNTAMQEDTLEEVFPSSIKSIGDNAFNGRGLNGVLYIPPSITKIGDYAFANNPQLLRVVLPSTVEYIGDHAFDGCGLTRFVLPDSCSHFGAGVLTGCPLSEGYNSNTIEMFTHNGNYDNENVTLNGSNGLTISGTLDLRTATVFDTIGVSSFSSTNIVTVHLPKTLNTIDAQAFHNCNRLTEVHFHTDGTVSLFDECFYGCTALSDIYLHTLNIPAFVDGADWFYGCGGSVAQGKKHIHVPTGMSQSTIINSQFYTVLIGLGYNVLYDL